MDCHNIRFRASGPRVFIDIHILTDGRQSLNSAHELTENIEKTIQDCIPDSDVTVHPEPYEETDKQRAESGRKQK